MPYEPPELYRRWLAAWTDRHAALEPIVAADAVGHWPEGDVVGPRGFARAIAETVDQFDRVDFDVQAGPLVGDGFVAARWILTCHMGDETMSFAGHDFVRVEDGVIAEYWPAISPAS
ncbi:nuclear transport factor 2 family protein [Leifsonia shinshuensis]|uniref:Ester cyclase n=1 Tax=Leifsonia shinshuensis TaxID=150026 RepID=A0A7G6YE69_9MICO|nr:nuclear transport factor 2 family protein [Leifsonia shinshuensis]QNE36784.1 ester cyclase [Leifsonia shinshuensis]